MLPLRQSQRRSDEQPSRSSVPIRQDTAAVVVLLAVLLTVSAVTNFLSPYDSPQFSYLAESFRRGQLFLTDRPGDWLDTVLQNGRHYWPLGPFPAVFLLPFVTAADLVGIFFAQGYLQFFLTLAILGYCFQLARRDRYSQTDALYLAAAFVFASVYHVSAFIPRSWYFAQALATLFLFAALAEYFGRRRYWLIGTAMGMVLMTRATAGLGGLFFIAAALTEPGLTPRLKRLALLQLLLPVAISGVLLLGYNQLRFGNPLDSGYQRANVHWLPAAQRYELLRYGLFDLRHIPTNLYYYLIKGLDPVRQSVQSLQGQTYFLEPPYVVARYPGVSFFVVAPIFLYAFRSRWRARTVRLSLLPIATTLVILLMYYWPGWTQVGPRYTLDFLPFGYLILLRSFPGSSLSTLAKVVTVGSALFNFYLTTTTFFWFSA